MQVLDELRHLESYVEELHKSGTSIRALYERVQSSGNVLPRLYLLVTVGSVFIKTKEAPANEVLMDLVEMTKGVQYPLRGLFLRNYLSICVKDKLPDLGSRYEGAGGTTEDAIAFLLLNFSEMNRLWIRMQHQKAGAAATKDKSTREKERQDLRILVGTSLVRLSQMDGVTLAVYSTRVLPKVLETIVSCKDTIAQQYLLDCVIQVFPDEFHMQNLDPLLKVMDKLQPEVDIWTVLRALLVRLTTYHATLGDKKIALLYGTDPERAQQKQEEVFAVVLDCVTMVLKASDSAKKKDSSARDSVLRSIMPFFESFVEFTLKCFEHKRTELLRRALPCVMSYLKEHHAELLSVKKTSEPEAKEPATDDGAAEVVTSSIKQICLAILRELSLVDLMQVSMFSELIRILPWAKARKDVALDWTRILLKRYEPVEIVDSMEYLVDLLSPLIRDDPDAQPLTSEPVVAIKDLFEMEQIQLAKIIHLARPADLDVKFQLFAVARRAFGQGGVFRIRFTLVPLIYQSLALARELAQPSSKDEGPETLVSKTSPREVLQFVHEMVTALASKLEQMSVTCVNLFLQCALVADACDLESIAYEFTTQAFIVYEDQITHSKDQWKALELMVTSLRATQHLSAGNYEVLAAKTTQYAARLLKKQDQAIMVLHCAHLFWVRDARRLYAWLTGFANEFVGIFFFTASMPS